ncbi:MAG: hypothetical protein ACSHXI_20590 [Hoeflea sp.]|uniref:hypothetical protein n=1 Tax=Hoeflea sp. TaxID=1940281 RepID=UPI003EFA673E
MIAIGSNDVPKYGGGTYLEGSSPDHRCAVWQWNSSTENISFVGCHNSRHKKMIEEEISNAISTEIGPKISEYLANKMPTVEEGKIGKLVEKFFEDQKGTISLPRVKDLIEYSRSIHAEMDALFGALREGISPVGGVLFCTTIPCHNCARHLVTSGVKAVYYVEPYVKSLALELHSDSIQTKGLEESKAQDKLLVLPFTGVGPRMYEDHFIKRGELKGANGEFVPPSGATPISGARLGALDEIEKQAAELAKL